jgi:hypothetical protein
LITRIHKEPKKLNSPKFNDPNGQRKWADLFQRKMSQWLKKIKTHEEMLIIPGMQIKTVLRFHLIPVRMATIKNTYNNKCWWGCGEKRTLIHYWRECKN